MEGREPETMNIWWSPDEDSRLIELVETYGTEKWSLISANMPGRTTASCRSRWLMIHWRTNLGMFHEGNQQEGTSIPSSSKERYVNERRRESWREEPPVETPSTAGMTAREEDPWVTTLSLRLPGGNGDRGKSVEEGKNETLRLPGGSGDRGKSVEEGKNETLRLPGGSGDRGKSVEEDKNENREIGITMKMLREAGITINILREMIREEFIKYMDETRSDGHKRPKN